MTPRERVISALSGEIPDWVPKEAVFSPAILKLFKEKTGSDSPEDYFNIEVRYLELKRCKKRGDFSRYLPNLPPEATIDKWGLAEVKGSMYHFTRYIHPMKQIVSANELDRYPFPDLSAPCHFDGLMKRIKVWHKQGNFVMGIGPDIFERAWYLRGMERLFEDWMSNPGFATELMNKVTSLWIKALVKMAKMGVDGIFIGDDVGAQNQMLISPASFGQWVKPYHARLIQEVKKVNPNLIIAYHSDGFIEPIIPDLIEIGVNVLNPIQPECMDPNRLKQRYGHDLAFWGTIGIQTTMPFGSPKDIRKVVKEIIGTVGKGGGLLIAPTHVLEPDVPWENILAFFEAVEEYGEYS